MRKLVVVALLGWLGLASALAAPTSDSSSNYEIELVVFEIRLPQLEGSELWTQAGQPIDTSEVNAPNEMPPSNDFAGIADALRADSRYRILLQKRWVQGAEPKSDGAPVQLATWDREIDGTLKFYLSRFLHLELNVLFQPQLDVIGADAAPSYVLKEERRIKSNDVNYFDHPKVGVLVRVTPVSG